LEFYQSEVKIKADELERSKQLLKEQHAQLSSRIEHLEHANEQLTKESSHSKLDKILREVRASLMICTLSGYRVY
jgi:prefoldin subunit 5